MLYHGEMYSNEYDISALLLYSRLPICLQVGQGPGIILLLFKGFKMTSACLLMSHALF